MTWPWGQPPPRLDCSAPLGSALPFAVLHSGPARDIFGVSAPARQTQSSVFGGKEKFRLPKSEGSGLYRQKSLPPSPTSNPCSSIGPKKPFTKAKSFFFKVTFYFSITIDMRCYIIILASGLRRSD